MRFITFVFFIFLFYSNSIASVTQKDSLALVALYDSTNGANWTNTWDFNQPISSWHGITVDGSNVTRIEFNQNNLVGHLPPQIGDLDSLEYLRLYRNTGLEGEIPAEIGNLKKLKTLDLNNNRFTGTIPREIGNLDSLERVNLDQSNLTGAIPAEITNCLKLESFRAAYNLLDSIPDLSTLPVLNDLWLSNNNFSGPFPSFFYNMPQLVSLNISGNQFDGQLSADIANLQSLRWFYFGRNNFSGTIPKEIGTMDQVVFLELYDNELTGEIPSELGDMQSLKYLRLHTNQLTGSIPEHLASAPNLWEINLGNNQLTGMIPDSIGYVAGLNRLYLTNNQLEGTLPATFTNLVNLESVLLSNNNFEGSLDGIFDNAKGLEKFYIDNNNFEGAIPDSFVNFPDLKWLYINDNDLDELPSFAGHSNLNFMDIKNNAFTFEDIEPQLSNSNLSTFIYSPQDSVGETRTDTIALGTNVSIGFVVGGSYNNYQWYKNDQIVQGATDSVFTINNFSLADEGKYNIWVTNDSVPDLTIYSSSIYLVEGTPSTIDDITGNLPKKFELKQNYPNPFNPLTTIKYSLPKASDVKIDVFNILGQRVLQLVNQRMEAGYHSVNFDGQSFSSGEYYYVFKASGRTFVRKMLLVK